MSRVAPSLEYFVVYNKTLQVATKPSHDDDDAQEEAHILFYTCRPGGVKRDKMLRQIGLAKALISFSEAFTNGNGEACEMVHSARTKLVMVSPEKDYWIHACVNVAYIERTNKDGAVKKEYQESSLHDIALKTAVLKAYQEFKLLHGSFASLLNKSRPSLERHLEKFFSVWAWSWDVEAAAEFISHLGTPLSAYCKYISPLVDEVQAMLPENTPVLFLSSTSVLASSPPPSDPLWTTLPSHLIRLIPPYEPPPPVHPGGSAESTLKALKRSKSSESKLGRTEVVLPGHRTSGSLSTVNFFAGISSAKKWTGFLTFNGRSRPTTPHLQDAVTPPKAKSAPPASQDGAYDATQIPLPMSAHPDVDQQSLDEAIASLQISGPQEAVQKAGSQDTGNSSSLLGTHTSVLTPALEYITSAAGGLFGITKTDTKDVAMPADNSRQENQVNNQGSQESEEPKHVVSVVETSSPGGDEDEEETKTETSLEDQTAAEQSLHHILEQAAPPDEASDVPPALEQPTPEPVAQESGPDDVADTEARSSQISSRRSSVSVSQPDPPRAPPEAFFVPLGAYIDDEETNELSLRRVYHMSVQGIMLALVVRSSDVLQSPTDTSTLSSRRFASFGGVEVEEGLGYPAYTDLPRGLEYKAVDVLRSARRILDKWELERGKDASAASLANSGANGMRRFAVAGQEPGVSVLASLGFSSTAGWLFEGQSNLRRDGSILEQFSRTTTSQSWYIAKRLSGSKRGGPEREVHMEVARKDSNLVDVDNDLATLVRRLDSTTY
ncbi:hypothetical protein M408DRAFT_59921 [Serendipita vermifera MAFF 305830]|uniref:CCZ1/INTU/HSP4 first Longin domain-containing protein n=1 Tax=Serendipita vermifera MAFF 305830 TaxID=933852 RepID=A0A0C3BPW3_SERVB|nr:hypothetical protein M408DRAFT_59921 [Serendipita vermifera MAFF 305830]